MREYPWIDDEMIHSEAKARSTKPHYPADHQVGIRVPKGGSDCAKCEYLKSSGDCGNRNFIAWNGSGTLPAPADEYCCDFFEAD